ncbi:MAG: acyl-CoA dehydrogenase family protein [Chloroflexi bacterium]|nr:acyl-CoA dehydrogenase family protein [Chloroflexota bacterium]
MDFELTAEQRDFRERARRFAQREIEPIAAQVNEDGKIPPEMNDKLTREGFVGLLIPKEYGGTGAGMVNCFLVLEQLSYPICACLEILGNNIVGRVIAVAGTEEQKRQYLPPLAQGKVTASYAFTEPGTGSDAKSLVTTARLEGDNWVINGIKRFHSAGNQPGPAIVFANVDGTKTTAFLVDKLGEGYRCSKPFELMMGRGLETLDTRFGDLKIPKSHVLGAVGAGFNILTSITAEGRLTLSATALATAQAALDESVAFVKECLQGKGRALPMDNAKWLLAEMAMRIQPARIMAYRIAWQTDEGQDTRMTSAVIKLLSSRVSTEVADMAMDVLGADGLIKGTKMERIYRQAKQFELTEGTSEVQRTIVAGSLLMQ